MSSVTGYVSMDENVLPCDHPPEVVGQVEGAPLAVQLSHPPVPAVITIINISPAPDMSPPTAAPPPPAPSPYSPR